MKAHLFVAVPALFWMLIPLVVEVQRDFGVQSDAKVVIHHTLLGVAVPTETHTLGLGIQSKTLRTIY